MRLEGCRITIVFRLLLIVGLFLALSLPVSAERLPVKIYTNADGLAHDDINRIVRDSRGFLWFCTFEGLSRFDGYGFTSYGIDHGLPSPVVNDLLETHDGNYWVATAAGVCRFNPTGTPQAMFTVFFPGEDPKSRIVKLLLEDRNGVIWCGTDLGLFRLETQGGRVEFHLVDIRTSIGDQSLTAISSITGDSHGVLWIGSREGINRLLTDGRVELYHKKHGLPDNNVQTILEDREGRIWVGFRLGGLCRLVSDPDTSRPVVARIYTERDGLPTRWINQIFQASDGTFMGRKQSRFDPFYPDSQRRLSLSRLRAASWLELQRGASDCRRSRCESVGERVWGSQNRSQRYYYIRRRRWVRIYQLNIQEPSWIYFCGGRPPFFKEV